MVNIWEYADYPGTIEVTTDDGKKISGTVIEACDAHEFPDEKEDYIVLEPPDGAPRIIYASEIIKIKPTN